MSPLRVSLTTCWIFRDFDDLDLRGHEEIFGDFCSLLLLSGAASLAYSMPLHLSTSKQYFFKSSKSRKSQHALRRWAVNIVLLRENCGGKNDKNDISQNKRKLGKRHTWNGGIIHCVNILVAMCDRRSRSPNLTFIITCLPSRSLFSTIWAYHLPSNHYQTENG